MKHFRTILISAVLLLTLLSACGGGGGNEVVVGDADQGTAVELEVGQVLVVELVSNPTTGYSWQVLGIDEAVLAQQGEPVYVQDPQSEGLVGAGGTETFRFEAQQAGQTSLSLGYLRPWEENVDPIETFSITVTVR